MASAAASHIGITGPITEFLHRGLLPVGKGHLVVGTEDNVLNGPSDGHSTKGSRGELGHTTTVMTAGGSAAVSHSSRGLSHSVYREG